MRPPGSHKRRASSLPSTFAPFANARAFQISDLGENRDDNLPYSLRNRANTPDLDPDALIEQAANRRLNIQSVTTNTIKRENVHLVTFTHVVEQLAKTWSVSCSGRATIATNPGDLILDSFAGSGTTGAVAQKMGRRWIMVEIGDHADTHIVPRLRKVLDGSDRGGISKAVGWQGGGGFRYYTLAPSLLARDPYGNLVIAPEYDGPMLARAMCAHLGFTYAPSTNEAECPAVRAQIVADVIAAQAAAAAAAPQGEMLAAPPAADVALIVEEVTSSVADHTIAIPEIVVLTRSAAPVRR